MDNFLKNCAYIFMVIIVGVVILSLALCMVTMFLCGATYFIHVIIYCISHGQMPVN